jgi:hypothetical protein
MLLIEPGRSAASLDPDGQGGGLTARCGADGRLPLWGLPLAAGLLPLAGVAIAFWLAVSEGQFAACNPLLEGCVSISRASRYGLSNILFRAFVLPAAALQALTWWLAVSWLRSLGAPALRRLAWVPWLGIAAALFLVLYGTFLGTDGPGYRWMRRFGVVFYFGFTCLLMLLVTDALRRTVSSGAARVAGATMLLLPVLALPLLGVINSLAPLVIADPEALDRFENATEWWGGLAFTIYFGQLAWLWRRSGFAARLTAGPP